MNGNTARRLIQARKAIYGGHGSKRRSVELKTTRAKHPISDHGVLAVEVSGRVENPTKSKRKSRWLKGGAVLTQPA